MRLGTCVALELVIGASAAFGLALTVSWGAGEVSAHLRDEAPVDDPSQAVMARHMPVSAAASRASRAPLELDLSEPAAEIRARTAPPQQKVVAAETAPPLETAPPVEAAEPEVEPDDKSKAWRGAPYYGVFGGVRDDLLLAPLRGSSIVKVKYNRGGSSISLRLQFANGARAAFKPQQLARQTIPRKEVAAYRIDRLLGLEAVPPAILGRFAAKDIIDAVVESSQTFLPRLREEMILDDKGDVKGELSWWIPVIDRARIDGYEIDTTDGIVTWKRYLTVGQDIPDESRSLVAQISSMVLFDFIINNPDRWSGANARVSEDGRILYFMDNTMSFGDEPDGHRKCRIYLRRSQKFSRSLVTALRGLTIDELREYMSWDLGPFDELLDEDTLQAVVSRRDYALTYIDELIAEHGEGAVLVFP